MASSFCFSLRRHNFVFARLGSAAFKAMRKICERDAITMPAHITFQPACILLRFNPEYDKNISDTLAYNGSRATFLFLPYFDVSCDRLLNRRTATWSLFAKQTCSKAVSSSSISLSISATNALRVALPIPSLALSFSSAVALAVRASNSSSDFTVAVDSCCLVCEITSLINTASCRVCSRVANARLKEKRQKRQRYD